MTNRIIIGLTGYAGSGKDTAAQVLIENGFTRIAFADPVRSGLLALNPLVEIAGGGVILMTFRLQQIIEATGWDRAKQIPEVRSLLQRYGTEAGREIHGPNCWIEIAKRKINEAAGNVVVTDVRFPNEIDLVRELGGQIYRVNRPDYEPVNTHVSDQIQNLETDADIENDGTIEDLQAKVLNLLGSE